ncbi:hypothetical protein BH23ACT6_BH23ACT6_07890 [soil metagenome]
MSRPPSTSSPTQVSNHGLDLRLLIPALIGWSAGAWLAGRPSAAIWQVLAMGLTAAVVGGLVGWRSRRTTLGLPWLLALAGLAVVVITGSALGHRAVQHAGPVPELAAQRAVVQMRGTVMSQPRLVSTGTGEQQVMLRLRLDQVTARGMASEVSTPSLVFAPSTWLDVPWRSQVTAQGRLALPRDRNGSTSTFGDVVAVFSPMDDPAVQRGPPVLLRSADHVRGRLRAAVDGLPADARGLIPGLVIGDTSLTPPELSDAMLETGMSHLSAVSGSNVAIVLGAVVLICRWVGVPRRWRAPLGALALVCFVILCRPEPSVLRAGVMGLIALAGLSAARRSATVPALAAAILVLLCIDPTLARSYGFALSCVATLGLVVFARPWADAIAARLPPRAALMGDAIAIPLAAQVVCAPIIILLQGDIAIIAVLANLLAAPMVAFTTVSGIAVAIGATVWLPLGSAVAWLAALPALWIATVARVCESLPFGHVEWLDGGAGAWSLAVASALLVFGMPWLTHHARRRPRRLAAAGAAVLACALPLPGGHGWPPSKGFVVVACDVGQGDAFVVSTGAGSALLVDVGPPDGEMIGCLRDLDVRRVDAVVISHFHADHIGAWKRCSMSSRSARPTSLRCASPLLGPLACWRCCSMLMSLPDQCKSAMFLMLARSLRRCCGRNFPMQAAANLLLTTAVSCSTSLPARPGCCSPVISRRWPRPGFATQCAGGALTCSKCRTTDRRIKIGT